MSPDTIQSIRADFEAGMSYRELAEKHGTSKSAVGRLAKQHGWTKGKQKRKPKKATKKSPSKPKASAQVGQSVGQRDSGTVGQEVVSQAKPPAPVDQITIEDRLDWNTKAASRGAKAGLQMLERGQEIIATKTTDSAVLQAASNMVTRGMDTIEKANRMQRLNGGLPTSIEKGETTTKGILSVEQITPEVIQQSASEAFGVNLGRLAEDAVPVAEGMDN